MAFSVVVSGVSYSIPEPNDTGYGAQLDGYLKAVATSIRKLDDLVSVKDYGAVGDGVANDTNSVLAAYTAVKAKGGEIYFPAGTYLFNLTIVDPYITISGTTDGKRDSPSKGTVFRPWDKTIPVIGVGDGTASTVEGITLRDFGMRGDDALTGTSDGIQIKGAAWVNLINVSVTSFGRDNVTVASSATVPSYFLFFTNFRSSYARANCLKFAYGAQYVTAVFLSNFEIDGYTTSASRALFSDGVELQLTNGWIQAGGSLVGHVELTKTGAVAPHLTLLGVTVDSASSADVLVEMNATIAATALTNYLHGFFVVDGLLKWDAGATTVTMAGSRAAIYDSSRVTNPKVQGILYFNQQDASPFDDSLATTNARMYRTGADGSGNETVVVDNAGLRPAQLVSRRVTLTYSGTIATDTSIGNSFTITATNGTAFTISNPTGMKSGQRIKYTIRNTSGGALGAITWGGAFKMAAFTAPTNTNSRSIEFEYDGTNWIQHYQSAADVPN